MGPQIEIDRNLHTDPRWTGNLQPRSGRVGIPAKGVIFPRFGWESHRDSARAAPRVHHPDEMYREVVPEANTPCVWPDGTRYARDTG